MSERPLIGITSYAQPARWGSWELPAALVPLFYVESVERAGGRALVVPPSTDAVDETPLHRLEGDTLIESTRRQVGPLLRGFESLDERGMVLGFLPDARYTSATVRDLAGGDRIVFYTDGITEASRADGEFFGDRQFSDVLTVGRSQPPDRFLATLVDRAREWTGADFEDDVTVVVVDWIRQTAV